jgi:hypothetical protein
MTGVGAASFPIHRSRIVIARIFRERAPWHESNGGHDACPGSRLLGIGYSGTDSKLRAMRVVDRLETVLNIKADMNNSPRSVGSDLPIQEQDKAARCSIPSSGFII